jgi:Domain of unknown function (DUF222)/HNH endonuclease
LGVRVDGFDAGPIEGFADAMRRMGEAQRDALELIAVLDRSDSWVDEGARDMAHWLWINHGMSDWKARRWIAAAHALAQLPRIAQALAGGVLSVDKVVELTRFATPTDETHLIAWAEQVSPARIRHEADLRRRVQPGATAIQDEQRTVRWCFLDEGRRFELFADLPAAYGAVVARAIDRIAAQVPEMPGELGHVDARRADALIALCSAHLAADADPDRATVVVHARVGDRSSSPIGAAIEGGGIADPSIVDRLLCDARVQIVWEGATGRTIGIGRTTRVVPAWLGRQVRYRDKGCRFPGCGTTAFTQAHHVRFWRNGGRTDLDNLVLICSFHHKLVHEYGWRIEGDAEVGLRWYRGDGTRYRAGPPQPDEPLLAIAS